jgi:hypothetical protein
MILDEINQHTPSPELGITPSSEEILMAIKKMNNDKAPRFSQVTTDMIKNLPSNALSLLTEFIHEYWNNSELDYTFWNKTKLSNLYKGKGDPQNPNNWRGICLKETTAKIVNIIAAERLLKQLKKVGTPTQFSHIGCQEALHSIR